jgi:hypothetical protein
MLQQLLRLALQILGRARVIYRRDLACARAA